VTFEGGPADPSVVLKDLNDGSAPAVHQVKEASYQPPLGHYKTAGTSDSVLAEAFGVGMEKVADVQHTGRFNRGDEAADVRTRLATMGDVVCAWASYADTPMIKRATKHLHDHLRAARIMGTEQQVESLSKTAGAGSVPNPAHPVVERFIAFCKVAHEHSKLEHAIDITDEQIKDVDTQLRSL
jgi:hypothetical protein